MRWCVAGEYGQLMLSDVAGGEQFVHAHELGAELGLHGRGHRLAVRVGDGHAECPRPPGERLADVAHADDAQPAALDARAEHVEHAPLPRRAAADDPLAFTEATGGHQHERHRDVGGGLGEHTRGVRADHATRRARRDVDVVVADGDVGDDLQLRAGGVEEGVVDLRRQQRQYRVGTRDHLVHLLDARYVERVPRDHVAGLVQQFEAGVGNAAGDGDARHQTASIQLRRPDRPSWMSSTDRPE